MDILKISSKLVHQKIVLHGYHKDNFVYKQLRGTILVVTTISKRISSGAMQLCDAINKNKNTGRHQPLLDVILHMWQLIQKMDIMELEDLYMKLFPSAGKENFINTVANSF